MERGFKKGNPPIRFHLIDRKSGCSTQLPIQEDSNTRYCLESSGTSTDFKYIYYTNQRAKAIIGAKRTFSITPIGHIPGARQMENV